jgi:thiopeptide-type bacteriocin biosynthesis protein
LRVLPRFLYRAPLLPVGAPLEGALAEQALALAGVVPEARDKYARRAAFRATPHGLLAGVGVGTLGDETRAATGPMRASVTVAYERLWRIARERIDPATARLRVAPSLVRDETTALWLKFGDESEAIEGAAEVDELLAHVLDAAADWIAWSALVEAVAVDDDFLFLLVDDGLLVHDGAPPLVGPPPLLWMTARHPEWSELAAETPKHAVLVHEGEVTLARAVVERAAALAPLLFRLQEALAPPMAERALDAGTRAALRAVEESFGAGAYDLDALQLGRYGTPLDVDDDAPPPAQDAGVVREIVGAIVRALATRTVATLDVAMLESLAPPVALPPSFELMLAPTRGDDWLVGLHAPAGASWGRFLHAVGAPLVDAMQPLAALPATVDVDFAPSLRLGDLTAHPPLRARAIALSSWPWNSGDALPLGALSLALDSARGEPSLQAGDAAIVPAPSWRVRSTTAPRGAARLVTSLPLVRQHAPWALTLGVLGDLPHVPRMVLAGFVVAPASWRLASLRDRDALRSWRELWGVPDAVQVGEGDELMLVRLDDDDALEQLRGATRAYEVWPPLDASIDAGGRRIEAIVAVIDDEAEVPAPLPRVPPPAERAGASGWHTWKIFGAADRAERVLCGAVAPAIVAAQAAGEIDGWFFLRYVDGPGRRDHLRLRVHATSDAAFATRLDAALAPARAAGDVVTVERAEYQRELGRYGADAIDAVERVFEADSVLVLALYESEADDDVVELLVASYDALAAGAGLDDAERHALARRRRDAYGLGRDDALADEYRGRQPSLRALLATRSDPFAAHAARVAAALAPLSPDRRAQLLPAFLHLAAVRLLGVDAAREAAAIYFWERTRESLGAAPPSTP